jgi:hypothetical protein
MGQSDIPVKCSLNAGPATDGVQPFRTALRRTGDAQTMFLLYVILLRDGSAGVSQEGRQFHRGKLVTWVFSSIPSLSSERSRSPGTSFGFW